MFRDPITISAPHIYISALPFAPRKTRISEIYLAKFGNVFNMTTQVSSYWPRAMHVLEGHTSEVSMAVYSPDGKTIVSGSYDCTIRLWDASTGKSLGAPIFGTSWINSVKISPDGTKIIASLLVRFISIWDFKSRIQLHLLSTNQGETVFACSPDSKTIASSFNSNDIMLWDVESGAQLVSPMLGHTARITAIAYSSDGKTCVSASEDMSLKLWNTLTGTTLNILHFKYTAAITCIVYCSDDTILFGSNDQTIMKWNVNEDNKSVVLISDKNYLEGERIYCMAISPDGKILAYAKSNLIELFDLVQHIQVEQPLKGHIWPVLSLAFSLDGKQILSASADNTIRIWNWQTNLQHNIQNTSDSAEIDSAPISLAFSPDNKYLASGLVNGLIKIWNAVTGEEEVVFKGHSSWISCLEYALSGKQLISSSSDSTIRCWNTDSRKQEKNLRFIGHTSRITFVKYSADGSIILSGGGNNDCTLRVWNPQTGEQIYPSCIGHTNDITGGQISADNKKILSSSYDKTIKQWDLETGELQISFNFYSVTGIAYSPDEKTIISGSLDKFIQLHKSEDGSLIDEYNTKSFVYKIQISHDGAFIFYTTERKIIILNANNIHMKERIFCGHIQRPTAIALSYDGKCFATTAYDSSIRIWQLKPFLEQSILAAQTEIKNGWITGTDQELLLWIPQNIQGGLYRDENTLVISKNGTTQLNLTRFTHGLNWAKCYTSI